MTVYAIDFSGSTDRDLALRAAQQIAKTSDANDVALTFDTQIVGVVPAPQAASLINNAGGGGTSVQKVLDWANGRGHKAVTIYTDGWFHEGSLNTYDLLATVILMGADKDVAKTTLLPVVGRLR